MLSYSSEDIVEIFQKAPNLNAAVKSFLKREVNKGDPAEKFAKAFKSACGQEERLKTFITKQHERFQREFMLLANYAHADFIGDVSEEIITTHSESFNETYSREADSVKITDQGEFNNIIKKAFSIVDHACKSKGFPSSGFLKNVFIATVFDEDLIEHVVNVLEH